MKQESPKNTSIVKAQALSHKPGYNKNWRVDDLPEWLRKQVIDLLKRHSPRTVAEVIRDAGYHLDIAPITLQHYLEAYRRERINLADCINPYMVAKLTSELKAKVNCLSAMSDLITMQQERIRVARMGELDGELDPEVNKQVHLLTRMLKVYADMGIKSGLMQNFIHQYEKECREEEEAHTLEIETIFGRVVRSLAHSNPEMFDAIMKEDTAHDESDID